MQNMPTGSLREETGFKKESSSKMAKEWLECEAAKERIHIHHKTNDTEKRIGERGIPVDSSRGPSQTTSLFQFQGCGGIGITVI